MTAMPTIGTSYRRMGRKAIPFLVLLASMAASYFAFGLLRLPGVSRYGSSSGATPSAGEARVNPFASANGLNLIAFIITASDCGWSAHPNTMRAVGNLRRQLQTVYADNYARVSVVGVALDQDPSVGFSFLSDMSDGELHTAFDQVVIGGSWLNEQVVRFVWREAVAEAASPQVIVIERTLKTDSYLAGSGIQAGSDKLIANFVGSADIINWIDLGVPLDPSIDLTPP